MNRYDIALGKGSLPVEPILEPMEPVLKSDRDELVQRNLRTTQGRSKIASSMTNSIEARLNYGSSFARRFLYMEQLPDGALPLYDKSRDASAYTIDENARNVLRVSNGHRVAVPLFEISANPQIALTLLRHRQFDAISRVSTHVAQTIRNVEEGLCLSLLNGVANNSDRNISTNDLTLNQDVFREAFSTIERADLKVSNVLMNTNNYSEMLSWGREDIDARDHYVRPDAGIMGGMWGATIITSRAVPAGDIYLMAEPQFVGCLPVRTAVTVFPADNPAEMAIGWSIFENIGMACHNPSAVLRIRLTDPPPTQFLDSCVLGGKLGEEFFL